MYTVKTLLAKETSRHPTYQPQVIWMTTPPISVEIRGGFMVEQLEFQKYSMRFNIIEANNFAAKVAVIYGFDV